MGYDGGGCVGCWSICLGSYSCVEHMVPVPSHRGFCFFLSWSVVASSALVHRSLPHANLFGDGTMCSPHFPGSILVPWPSSCLLLGPVHVLFCVLFLGGIPVPAPTGCRQLELLHEQSIRLGLGCA